MSDLELKEIKKMIGYGGYSLNREDSFGKSKKEYLHVSHAKYVFDPNKKNKINKMKALIATLILSASCIGAALIIKGPGPGTNDSEIVISVENCDSLLETVEILDNDLLSLNDIYYQVKKQNYNTISHTLEDMDDIVAISQKYGHTLKCTTFVRYIFEYLKYNNVFEESELRSLEDSVETYESFHCGVKPKNLGLYSTLDIMARLHENGDEHKDDIEKMLRKYLRLSKYEEKGETYGK